MQKSVAEARIFSEKGSRIFYLTRLNYVLKEEGALLFAYALMDTHVHLILMSLQTLVDRILQRIGTAFAIYYNLKNDRRGHVFGQPFWSNPIEDDDYFRNAVRYTQRNPLEGGIFRTLRELRAAPDRTNFAALMGDAKPIVGEVHATLSRFGSSPEEARANLVSMMQRGNEGFDPFAKANAGVAGAAGEEERRRREVAREERARRAASIARVRATGIEFPDIVRLAASTKGVSIVDVERGCKQPDVSAARALTAHFAVNELGMSQTDVARALGITQVAVSRAMQRGARLAAALGISLLGRTSPDDGELSAGG